MIKYKVQPGDMIGVLAVKYNTTIRTLMNDNPLIQTDQKLQPGWILKIYTPAENAKRHSENAYEQIESAARLKEDIEIKNYLLSEPREPVYYKEREVLEGQVAFAKTIQETPLLELQANGFIKKVRTLPKGEILRVYEATTYNGGMYLVNNQQWITSSPEVILYDEIPQYNLDGKIDMRKKGLSVSAVNPNDYSNIGYGKRKALTNLMMKPQSMIGSGSMKKHTNPNGVYNIPHFQRPNYKRPVLIMKNAKGETKTVELRVLGFSASYGNAVQPSATNDGWMINIRGANLATLTISGYLMETKAADEFNEFMDRYHKYLSVNKSGDYYTMGISTFYYKKTEYKGIFTSFAYTDTENESLHRKYTLSMLVLKEKNLDLNGLAKVPTVVRRNGLSEQAFRSDIGSMLADTITGWRYAIYK